MSYQVLARKWRPKTFTEMVGQEHVLKALVNALDDDRLHHAYLFTGTRGVGKTSIARLFAKSLNCQDGVSSQPCGQCGACVEIAEGRFVDLIEVDAASRTKVEDTRELLENVQYAPTHGRYKVYLIDEVHMLSTHSFNALLKTLRFDDYQQYLNQYWRPGTMYMENHQTGKSTRLVWSNYRFKTGLSDRDFNKNSLKRAK